jgi:putative endonuclease
MNKTSDVLSYQYFIYILFSHYDHKLYIGYTADLNSRLKEHENGYVSSTKLRRPLQLIFSETFYNQKDAKARERFLKSGFGREQLKYALKNTLESLGYEYS